MRQNHTLLKEGLRFDRPKTPTSPENLRGGAISPKAPCQQTRTAAETDRRKDGPLGDCSLPRRLFGLQSKVPTTNSALPVHLRALTGRPHTPDAGSGDPAYTEPRR